MMGARIINRELLDLLYAVPLKARSLTMGRVEPLRVVGPVKAQTGEGRQVR